MNSVSLPIVLKYEDENARFECVVDKGVFPEDALQYGKNLTLKPGDGFRWYPDFNERTKYAYVDVFLKTEDNIIGYAVIEIYPYHIYSDGHVCDYRARFLKSIIFPKIDGKYQNITKEYVQAAIEEVKNKYQGKEDL